MEVELFLVGADRGAAGRVGLDVGLTATVPASCDGAIRATGWSRSAGSRSSPITFEAPARAGGSDESIRQALYRGGHVRHRSNQLRTLCQGDRRTAADVAERHFEVVSTTYDLLLVDAITEQYEAADGLIVTLYAAGAGRTHQERPVRSPPSSCALLPGVLVRVLRVRSGRSHRRGPTTTTFRKPIPGERATCWSTCCARHRACSSAPA